MCSTTDRVLLAQIAQVKHLVLSSLRFAKTGSLQLAIMGFSTSLSFSTVQNNCLNLISKHTDLNIFMFE